jgi:DNA-binding NarL/FixJ family response regulator
MHHSQKKTATNNEIDFIPTTHKQSENASIVIITIYDTNERSLKTLRIGDNGYLLKGQQRMQFLKQLEGVLKGIPSLATSMTESVLQSFHQPKLARSPLLNKLNINLTGRETEVLTLLAKGCSRKEIANLLNISANTVSGYVKEIYKKLRVNNSAEATFEAVKIGLVSVI